MSRAGYTSLALGALLGLRARKLRTALSGLGIAIGIAAAVAVLGISASSRANLLAQLGAEGNLVTVTAGQTFDGSPAALPLTAEPMIARIPPVESVTAIGYVPGATVRRTAAVPAIDSGGISVYAAQPGLLGTLGAGNKQGVAAGTFLNAATARYPAVVLGAVAAQTLGIGQVGPATQVYLARRYFAVIGILRPVPLVPALDEAALVGFPAADALLGLGGHPTQIYLRAAPDQVQPVVSVLPFTANPPQPEAVQVSLPSSILAARAAARTAYAGLFLGLGAVAVLVGGVGIANIMVIAVLERRAEIGLRRALGATRRRVGSAVPDRVGAAVGPGRRRRGAGRRGGHGGLRGGQRPARRRPRGQRRGRPRHRAGHRGAGRRLPGRAGRATGPRRSPPHHLSPRCDHDREGADGIEP